MKKTIDELCNLNKVIQNSGSLLLYIINDMIDLLNIQKGNLQVKENTDFNPMQACEEVLNLFKHGIEEKGITAKVQDISFSPQFLFISDTERYK